MCYYHWHCLSIASPAVFGRTKWTPSWWPQTARSTNGCTHGVDLRLPTLGTQRRFGSSLLPTHQHWHVQHGLCGPSKLSTRGTASQSTRESSWRAWITAKLVKEYFSGGIRVNYHLSILQSTQRAPTSLQHRLLYSLSTFRVKWFSTILWVSSVGRRRQRQLCTRSMAQMHWMTLREFQLVNK